MYGRRNAGRPARTSSDGGAWAWSGSNRDAAKRKIGGFVSKELIGGGYVQGVGEEGVMR